MNIELDPRMELSMDDITAAEIAPSPKTENVNYVDINDGSTFTPNSQTADSAEIIYLLTCRFSSYWGDVSHPQFKAQTNVKVLRLLGQATSGKYQWSPLITQKTK